MGGAIVVPIFHADKVVGALGIANRAERTFDENEIEALVRVARTLAARRWATA